MTAFQTGSATGHIDLLEQLRDFVSSDHVSAAVINAAGTGYVVGDILTVAGGTFFVAATVSVETVGGGGDVTSVKIRQSGGYTADPTLTGNAVTGGTGTGCTLDLTMTFTGWTVERDDPTAAHDATQMELILNGEGNGTDTIYVGMRTHDFGGLNISWELGGFTGFSSGLTWEDQPGRSPGYPEQTSGGNFFGSFFPLNETGIGDYWFNVTPRRIIVVAAEAGAYSSMYAGFMNPFATSVELPYPILIGASAEVSSVNMASSAINYSGISDPVTSATGEGVDGAGMMFRDPSGNWVRVRNSVTTGGTSRAAATTFGMIFPAATTPTITPTTDRKAWYGGIETSSALVPQSGLPGSATRGMAPTEDSGGDLYPLFPCTVYSVSGYVGIIGELEDVFWFPASVGGVAPQDVIDGNFTVFGLGNRSEVWTRWAMRTSEDP